MRYRRKKFTFAISSPDEFVWNSERYIILTLHRLNRVNPTVCLMLHVVISPPVGVRSIVISVSVCQSVWLSLGPLRSISQRPYAWISRWNIAKFFGIRKLESQVNRSALFVWSYVSHQYCPLTFHLRRDKEQLLTFNTAIDITTDLVNNECVVTDGSMLYSLRRSCLVHTADSCKNEGQLNFDQVIIYERVFRICWQNNIQHVPFQPPLHVGNRWR